MDVKILGIIDRLESSSFEEMLLGIELLDRLLFELLPEIREQKRLPQTNIISQLGKFTDLQDNFQYNIASRMLNVYRKFLEDSLDDMEVLHTCNRLLQGLLLTHPSSRLLFNIHNNMKMILRFIELPDTQLKAETIVYPLEVRISFVSTLIHILLKDLKNFRMFEQCNGCSLIIKNFKLSSMYELPAPNVSNRTLNQQDLNFKIIEFLFLYLTDEELIASSNSMTRTLEEKSSFFEQDFPEIYNLVENLNDLKVS